MWAAVMWWIITRIRRIHMREPWYWTRNLTTDMYNWILYTDNTESTIDIDLVQKVVKKVDCRGHSTTILHYYDRLLQRTIAFYPFLSDLALEDFVGFIQFDTTFFLLNLLLNLSESSFFPIYWHQCILGRHIFIFYILCRRFIPI